MSRNLTTLSLAATTLAALLSATSASALELPTGGEFSAQPALTAAAPNSRDSVRSEAAAALRQNSESSPVASAPRSDLRRADVQADVLKASLRYVNGENHL